MSRVDGLPLGVPACTLPAAVRRTIDGFTWEVVVLLGLLTYYYWYAH